MNGALLKAPAEPLRTLIDELLAEQQTLTAVERFAQKHERHALPAQARYYRELIPLTRPGPGQQYAFGVDLDACTGCKACVSACHSLNGLEEEEIWRNVGSIHGGTSEAPYQQTVTTACHHCVDPGCLSGCPVAAYEKDATTGIVRHLDDQCIGCEYCLLKCPYDVPKYSKKRGIVRKCDMCSDRLAVGEAPACVQACPNGAITIRLAEQAQARAEALPGVRLLPGAFESSYTRPTTLYTTRRPIPANAHPGDVYRLRLEHPHWPLIAMLLLSQLSAGLYGVLALGLCLPGLPPLLTLLLAGAGFAALQAGLVLSVFHLGQPQKAWRFFLGLRTSWMSREILVFSLFAAASGALLPAALAALPGSPAAQAWLEARAGALGPWVALVPLGAMARGVPLLAGLTALLAAGGIFCSAMIYIDTWRPFWQARLTLPKFFGTAASLGVAAAAVVVAAWSGGHGPLALGAGWLSVAVGGGYSVWEFAAFRRQWRDEAAPAHRSARTVRTLLRPVLELRSALVALFLGAALLACLTQGSGRLGCLGAAFLALAGASVCERFIFFTASDAPRMPGGIAT